MSILYPLLLSLNVLHKVIEDISKLHFFQCGSYSFLLKRSNIVLENKLNKSGPLEPTCSVSLCKPSYFRGKSHFNLFGICDQ